MILQRVKSNRCTDMTGERIGHLTVREFAGGDGHVSYWRCECDCGAKVLRSRTVLLDAQKKGMRSACPECVSLAASLRPRKATRLRRVREETPMVTPYCSQCFGMSHRRPRKTACECGELHAPEQIEPVEVERRSWWQ